MNMIGHHRKRAQFDIFSMTIFNLIEIMHLLVRANGNKIGTRATIIPCLQACGADSVSIPEFFRHSFLEYQGLRLRVSPYKAKLPLHHVPRGLDVTALQA
jgi:hypothetical protein